MTGVTRVEHDLVKKIPGVHCVLNVSPKSKRRWGYYCLPILYKDRLVGRFDPKLERESGTLRLKSLYLEPDIEPEPDLVAGVAAAMRDWMVFHDARDLVIETSEPAVFGKKLLTTLDASVNPSL